MGPDTGGIPIEVLEGTVREYKSVGAVYKAHFARKIIELLNRSFWTRAMGGTDYETGSKWKPLSSFTDAVKLGRIEGPENEDDEVHPHVDEKFETNKYLTPAQQERYRKIKSKYSIKGRAVSKRALRMVGPDYDVQERIEKRKTPINVRTGRLVASTFPGNIINNRYYAVKDQKVTWDGLNFEFDILVPYADDVDEQREIVPENILPWVLTAHRVGIREARKEYEILRKKKGKKKPGRFKRRPGFSRVKK